MRRFPILIVVALAAAAPARAEKAPVSLATVARVLKPKTLVVVRGTVQRQIVDHCFINDGTDDVLLDLKRVRSSLNVGDEVVAYGRYIGRSNLYPKHPEIEVLELAPANQDAGPALVEKYGVEPGTYPEPPPAPFAAKAPPPGRSVEERLEELNRLKSKGLVTDEEYKQQRARILDAL